MNARKLDQRDLFEAGDDGYDDRARARKSDPDTSHIAAAQVNMGERQARVLQMLVGHPDTSYGVAARLGLGIEVVSPAFRPLARKGLIRDSGRREIGERGRARIVWEVVKP